MAKRNNVSDSIPEVKVVTNTEVVETSPTVEEKPVEVKKSVEAVIYPQVGGNGKFQAVQFRNGYVVYNPGGQRATGIVDAAKAKDIVREQNQAAHIKG